MNAFHWRGPSMQIAEIVKRGRPTGSAYDDEERAQRHRQAALRHYHKSGKTARQTRQGSPA